MAGAVPASAYRALLRRFAVSMLTRYVILPAGLVGMSALTVPELRGSFGVWLNTGLWLCLAYFTIDGAVRLNAAQYTGTVLGYLRSPAGIIDGLSVIPVPLALPCGLPPHQGRVGDNQRRRELQVHGGGVSS